MIKFAEELKGNRIILKKPELSFDFAKTVYLLVDCSRDYLLPWLDWAKMTLKPEDSYGFLDFSNKNWTDGKECAYAIFKEKEFMGFVTILNIAYEHKRAEIGYWIGKPFAGNGYMQEAVKLVEKELFDKEFNKIIIRTDVLNKNSANVAKKCGYILEGVYKQHDYSPAIEAYRDINDFAKLKKDYR